MKELFPGYCKKTEDEIKRIWEHGIIMFDTNVLLNLYRYSDSTQNTIIELIKKFSEQIYLPHQAALEYNRNRYEVIAEQEKAYKEFLDKISQIQKDLQSTSKPPFLTSRVDKELNVVFEKVGNEVNESIQKYSNYLNMDPIYNSISELFSNRITSAFSEDELKEIYKEGEERYRKRVPPGFEDEKKEGNKIYGDLILWKQIIQKAKELKKDVILITDERKRDWWWKIKDERNMGPRQELVEEMKFQANVDFHMYSSERFLSYGQSFLKEKINQQALEEIQAMKKSELEEIKRIQFMEKRMFDSKAKNEMDYINNTIVDISKKIFSLNKVKQELFQGSIESDEAKEYLHSIMRQEVELNGERVNLLDKLNSIQKKLHESQVESNIKEPVFLRYFNEVKREKE